MVDSALTPETPSVEQNVALAREWIRRFNSHDVDQLVALYADDAVHTSPRIQKLFPETGGALVGRAALAKWWVEANLRTPGLEYEIQSITASATRVVIEYIRHAPGEADSMVAERFETREGKIVSSRVYLG